MSRGRLHQLPDGINPVRYRLVLRPNLETFTFRGEVFIDVEVKETTAEIVLNAVELQFRDVYFLQGVKAIPARSIDMNVEREVATIQLERTVEPGFGTLVIKFDGILNDQLRGFYKSQYTDPAGNTQYLASTQFEATDARRAFPCWDEPAMKAIFQVTITIQSHLTAVSNMHVLEEADVGDGYKTIRFAETPKMSTYLVAFVVGDIACIEAKADGGTLIRIWATKGSEKLGQFALDTAIKLLGYYNNYFGIPYPLEKLDHLAIPDFAAGAMENWGAITYREVALLFDPDNSAAATRQRIVEIIAHEMAHMWFGDLVTMDWWDDLWLNESFASWMGNKATASLFPEWNMWTQFLLQDVSSGMRMDGLKNSHPIEAKVKDPGEIRELFDDISYSKGASIIWMLEQYLGEDVFRNGLKSYLETHAYGNARTCDLWKSLEVVSLQPVTDLMDTWVKQTGFPLVSVKGGDDTEALVLSQDRFLYDSSPQKMNDQTLWKIPISIATDKEERIIRLLVENRSTEVSLGNSQLLTNGGWIKINSGQTGFYRVRYDEGQINRLIGVVKTMDLPATDRFGLQSDVFALTRAVLDPATDYLSLIKSYKHETETSIWGDISSNLHEFETLLSNEACLDRFENFEEEIFHEIYERIGWDPDANEGHLNALLRSTVLYRMGSLGNQKVIEEAKHRFDEFLKDPDALRADLRGVVYSIIAMGADRSTYDILWDLEKKATLQEEKRRLLGALSRPKDPMLLGETLERSLSDDVRSQDAVLVIVTVAASRFGRDQAWEFLKDNWTELDRRYGKGGFMVMRLVSIAESFATLAKADEVERFFADNPVPSAERTVQQAIESIRLNAKWLDLNAKKVSDWLEHN